jgi:single-stranded DNA-binding protein
MVFDPELSEENGVPFVNFELEIEDFRKGSGGEKVRNATYLSFEAWDSAALAIKKYSQEGDLIAVESIARNHTFTDNPDDPEDQYLETYFRVTNFKILTS